MLLFTNNGVSLDLTIYFLFDEESPNLSFILFTETVSIKIRKSNKLNP